MSEAENNVAGKWVHIGCAWEPLTVDGLWLTLPPAAGSGETRVNNRVLGGAPAITVFLKGGGFTLLRLGSQAKQIQPFLQLVARINLRGMKINRP